MLNTIELQRFMQAEEIKDVAIVIGRWQFPHNGHIALFNVALLAAKKAIIVMGSAHQARNPRNPWTWSERRDMILAALPAKVHARVEFLPVRDYFDDERWNRFVSNAVKEHTTYGESIVLVDHQKDYTSYYLNNFPGWTTQTIVPTFDIDATPLRKMFFGGSSPKNVMAILKDYAPASVLDYLNAWSELPAFEAMRREFAAVKAYREMWSAPFYLTADAVIKTSDKVLLVRRGGEIGHGLWALPGGHVNPQERFASASVRELEEETGFRVLESTMKAAFRGSAVFDHPLRSPRGRIVTSASFYDFGGLPCQEVEGKDDAAEANWFTLEELKQLESKLFDDHAMILDHFLHLFD